MGARRSARRRRHLNTIFFSSFAPAENVARHRRRALYSSLFKFPPPAFGTFRGHALRLACRALPSTPPCAARLRCSPARCRHAIGAHAPPSLRVIRASAACALGSGSGSARSARLGRLKLGTTYVLARMLVVYAGVRRHRLPSPRGPPHTAFSAAFTEHAFESDRGPYFTERAGNCAYLSILEYILYIETDRAGGSGAPALLRNVVPVPARDARGVQRAPKQSASINLSMTSRLWPL